MTLARFEKDDIELVIDTRTGEAFVSIRGYARMSGKAQSTIQSRTDRMSEGERSRVTQTAEIQTPGGLQGVRLIPAKLAFKWAITDKPELAEAMGEAGATVYIHQLAGYQVKSDAVSPSPALPQTYIQALKCLLESEEEKERLRVQNELQSAEIDDLEADVKKFSDLADESFTHSSIIRIAKLNRVSEKVYQWRKLKAATKIKG